MGITGLPENIAGLQYNIAELGKRDWVERGRLLRGWRILEELRFLLLLVVSPTKAEKSKGVNNVSCNLDYICAPSSKNTCNFVSLFVLIGGEGYCGYLQVISHFMTTVQTTYILLLMGLFSVRNVSGQTTSDKDVLISFVDTVKDEYGYKNLKGDTIIPLGKYSICFTDTFKTYAIVAVPYKGFVAIDRQENILYNVFPFDNGPNYVSGGLFRILIDNKIGYADSATGKIIIKPLFDCAWPFENGIAKVSTDCETKSDGEHSTWLSDSWFYIDKTGKKVNPPKTK